MSGSHTFAKHFKTAVLAFMLALSVAPQLTAEERTGDTERIQLRVLYAGNPGSERMQDFEHFLGEHFTAVKTTDYREFKPDDANDFDVVIFDWTSTYPRDANGKITWSEEFNLLQPQPPKLDRTFARPAVLIGAAGGLICNQLQIAINWKCLCLENVAHDVVTTHPVFQGPRPVQLDFYEEEKPLDYYVHPGTERIGEMIRVWKVHEKKFPEIDPGLVASRENFVATPDTEVISGGVNGKGPTSVAIGRHGNYLLWGFYGQPDYMTESGRNAFVNAVCYIKKFDGQAPGEVTFTYGSRDSLLANVYWLRSLSDEYIEAQVEKFKQMVAENPLPESQVNQVGDDPAAYFRKMFESYAQQVLAKLPEKVRQQCNDDTEQLIRFYRENLEYLRSDGKGGFEVDEDVRQLGISNRTPALLEKCVSMLEDGQNHELAQRVLERYTVEHYDSAADWREWLDRRGESIRFDDARGVFVAVRGDSIRFDDARGVLVPVQH